MVWEAEALRELPFLALVRRRAAFEVSYGYYIQTTSFGNAHLLQTGYRMPY